MAGEPLILCRPVVARLLYEIVELANERRNVRSCLDNDVPRIIHTYPPAGPPVTQLNGRAADYELFTKAPITNRSLRPPKSPGSRLPAPQCRP